MIVNSIQRDIVLKQGNSGHLSKSNNFREKNSADMCNRGYNANYCGSFTGKSEAATSFLDKILKSNWYGKFTAYCQAHNVASSALIALVLAGIMRPAAIMAIPDEEHKDDKIYASGQAMASGIMGFVFSTILTSPWDESIKKVFSDKKFCGKILKGWDDKIAELTAQKEAKTITDAAKKELKNLTNKRSALETIAKNLPDWVIGVPRAMLTIALIPPILKYVFGLEKNKKPQQTNTQQTDTPKMNFVEKDAFLSKEVK